MNEFNPPPIEEAAIEHPKPVRRRKLLPWWIKIFLWIFLVFGSFGIVGIPMALLGFQFQLALFGLETTDPMTLVGFLVMFMFLFKAATSLSLWLEKDWAVTFGIIDACIGIVVCGFSMLIFPFIDDRPGFTLKFRIELILLIPYLIKMLRLRTPWRNSFSKTDLLKNT